MIKKIKGVFRGKEQSIGFGEGTVTMLGIIFNGIIGGCKRKEEKYCYKKKRYPFLHDSSHKKLYGERI